MSTQINRQSAFVVIPCVFASHSIQSIQMCVVDGYICTWTLCEWYNWTTSSPSSTASKFSPPDAMETSFEHLMLSYNDIHAVVHISHLIIRIVWAFRINDVCFLSCCWWWCGYAGYWIMMWMQLCILPERFHNSFQLHSKMQLTTSYQRECVLVRITNCCKSSLFVFPNPCDVQSLTIGRLHLWRTNLNEQIRIHPLWNVNVDVDIQKSVRNYCEQNVRKNARSRSSKLSLTGMYYNIVYTYRERDKTSAHIHSDVEHSCEHVELMRNTHSHTHKHTHVNPVNQGSN